jgi:hypothetical protein
MIVFDFHSTSSLHFNIFYRIFRMQSVVGGFIGEPNNIKPKILINIISSGMGKSYRNCTHLS